MKDSFHVDMSGRIYESKTLGVALIGIKTKINYGCALKGNLIKLISKKISPAFKLGALNTAKYLFLR